MELEFIETFSMAGCLFCCQPLLVSKRDATGWSREDRLHHHHHHHCLTSIFLASMGWMVQPGSGKPGGCTRLQSDLAVFLQLDALPNANHSVSVVSVGVFEKFTKSLILGANKFY
ncbi:Hypothetical predicted protein [Octopus vulgaris]|uniref:Uncharacterized protein n=1 Tax=Octopus vulgaris TaxID=6645 RepID=A0AA36AN33_OCTVU|nr:Hypothetical predicted protein [Octopus vulgaris]